MALHPVLVLRFLVDDDDDVALFERQLVVVVGFAVVESAAPPVAIPLKFRIRNLVSLKL